MERLKATRRRHLYRFPSGRPNARQQKLAILGLPQIACVRCESAWKKTFACRLTASGITTGVSACLRARVAADHLSPLAGSGFQQPQFRSTLVVIAHSVGHRMTPSRHPLLSIHVFVGLLLFSASSALAAGVTHQVTAINGLQVDRYSWPDSSGLTRTVSLKQEGNGNPGHGGYAIQTTYQLNGQTITVNADSGGDGGFGYFVSHERFRDFTDGTSNTIASKIFGVDDSPLGSGFPVVGQTLSLGDPTAAAHR